MIQLKLYGLGGQGVVTAGKLLATAVAIYENKYAQTVPAYGHERRGAPVYADVILGEEPILVKSFVYKPDYVMVFDLAVLEKGVDVTEGAHANTCFVVNANQLNPELPFINKFGSVYYVDATKIALEVLGIDIPNSAMLGAFAATGVVSIDAVCAALEETFKGKAGERNVEAAKRCYEAVRKFS
ncbi:pyruvate ferredoxin oxidoreductase gamma subunit [Caldanaerovirga acetigignens]|uniref:Pyruvate ferredoxin oxidoreductase gamma subunit n=1 Tax=Caldanaerovirga acetigignens TaxID=447595 RepID=A0A1M7LQ97_9FIRM|nr:2-oxoacid:acceptor oxidoreductase family protein [Caldanaerovirga acetigignens]SHM80364.1 pyruvate ferredoxin oxidoreductase gamma subunit [Caldanaerovirga acetigignens]